MSKKTIAILKSFFETGDRPTQQQFADLIDSFIHKDTGRVIINRSFTAETGVVRFEFDDASAFEFIVPQNAPISFITGLQAALNNKVDKIEGKGLSSLDFTAEKSADVAANKTHAANPDVHVTPENKTSWDNKVDAEEGKGLSSNDYDDIEAQKVADAADHINNGDLHVTAANKDDWSNKIRDYLAGEEITEQMGETYRFYDRRVIRFVGNLYPFTTLDPEAEIAAGDWVEVMRETRVVDNLLSESIKDALSANQGRVLKGFIDNINALLNSDDTTLDELQEIVNYIKQNKADLQNLGISNIAGLQAALDNKVDKIAGKGLSTNDLTDEKLAEINANTTHKNNGDLHVTTENKTFWSNKVKDWTAENLTAEMGPIFRLANGGLYKYIGALPFATADFAAELTAGSWTSKIAPVDVSQFVTTNKENKFEEIQRFGKGLKIQPPVSVTDYSNALEIAAEIMDDGGHSPQIYNVKAYGSRELQAGWKSQLRFLFPDSSNGGVLYNLLTLDSNTKKAFLYGFMDILNDLVVQGKLTVNGDIAIGGQTVVSQWAIQPFGNVGTTYNKLEISPETQSEGGTQPKIYNFKAYGSRVGTAWYSEIRFKFPDPTSAEGVLYNLLQLQSVARRALVNGSIEATLDGKFGGKVDITGDLKVGGTMQNGALAIQPLLGQANDNKFEIVPAVSGTGGSDPKVYLFKAHASRVGSSAWTSAIYFQLTDPAFTDGTLFNLFTLTARTKKAQVNGDFEVTGNTKISKLDLTNVPEFVDDAAAAAGGVALGFGYINSSTGALTKRRS